MLIVIGPFRASRVNLAANDLVGGVPSPSAAIGLVESIVRKVGGAPWLSAALPVYHGVARNPGRTKPALAVKSGRTYANVEIVEDLNGHVMASIIAEIPGEPDVDDLRAATASLRFAGGAAFAAGRGERPQMVRIARTREEALRMVPRGFAMLPPIGRPGADVITSGAPMGLEALHSRLFATPRETGSGYLLPSAVGYALLESPAGTLGRKGVRDASVPHVFVEPIAGIAEVISIRNALWREMSNEEFSARFWRWSFDDAHQFTMFSQFHLSCVA